MTAISHHPDAATLMSYAAGSLTEPLAAVVAVHLDMCPRCGADVARLNDVGGALLAELAPAALSGPRPGLSLDSLRHRAASEAMVGERPLRPARHGDNGAPATLAKLIGGDLSAVRWRWLAPGIWHKPLPLSPNVSGDLRLLRVAAGRTMPDHGHGGSELTLMLEGAYRDETGLFLPGDLADLDETVEHRPVADARLGCICLIASERKARFKGLLARLYQPLTGM